MNKLHSIYPTIGTALHSKTLSRREAVILSRLRIGHSRVMLSYLLSADDQPMTSQPADTEIPLTHILVDCPNLQGILQRNI